jgi:DNA-binding transcriptional ArsR family regulator
MGVAGVKVYDKFSRVLRVETTVNDVSFFKHHRKVEHTKGEPAREWAPLKKTIYSLIDLREILLACNQRDLAFLSSLDDPSAGERDLQRGEFNIHSWRRADLSRYIALTPSAISRQLKRLRDLGVIKKVAPTYRYYLTRLGRSAIATATALTRFNILPAMASVH